MVAHAAEPCDDRQPCAPERGEVHAGGRVVGEVVEVDKGGLGQVVEREVEWPVSAATIAWMDAESDESRTVIAS